MEKTVNLDYLKKELETQAAKLEICRDLLSKEFPKGKDFGVIGNVLAIRADSAKEHLQEAIDKLDDAYQVILLIKRDTNLVN
jgi:hypothetical protein